MPARTLCPSELLRPLSLCHCCQHTIDHSFSDTTIIEIYYLSSGRLRYCVANYSARIALHRSKPRRNITTTRLRVIRPRPCKSPTATLRARPVLV
jgi:hypothetical protein